MPALFIDPVHIFFLKISFVAVRGKSYLSDIALDTISINDVNRCDGLIGFMAGYGNSKEGKWRRSLWKPIKEAVSRKIGDILKNRNCFCFTSARYRKKMVLFCDN